MVLAALASACGGSSSSTPAETPEAPTNVDATGPAPASAPAAACVTPEGASNAAPPTCGENCSWDGTAAKCVPMQRGAIVPQ